MRMRHLLPVIGIVAVLAGIFLLRTGDEEVIRARLEELRTLAEIRTPESGIEPLGRARQLAGFFSEKTAYDFTSLGHGIREFPSHAELTRTIARIRMKLASLELALQDIQVHIEGDTARVRLRGTGLGTIRGEDGPFLEIHTAEIFLEKHDDTWLISGARHIRDERQQTE